MANRECIVCGEKVRECMGNVNFVDFCLAMEGKIHFNEVRETCGKCKEIVTLRKMMKEGITLE